MKNAITRETIALILFGLFSYSSVAYINSKHAEAVSMIRLNEAKIGNLKDMLREVRDDVKHLLGRKT